MTTVLKNCSHKKIRIAQVDVSKHRPESQCHIQFLNSYPRYGAQLIISVKSA